MTIQELIPQVIEPTSASGWGWGRWLWRTLTSMRTAIVLLASLALAAVPGSLLPQRSVSSDPGAVTRFELEHPALSPWLDRAGLFEVYASPWFAAIYLLLLVSMTGCVLPRCATLWRSVRAAPPRAPRRMEREEGYAQWMSTTPPDRLLALARKELRARRYRVVADNDQVRSERGYVREVGNLMFHLSLLVLLAGVGTGRLWGFEGRVALVEGSTFTNVSSQYDSFTPSVWTDVENLQDLSVTLDSFDAEYALTGTKQGEPRAFDADVTYVVDGGELRQASVRPNSPLDVNETKFFLTGHGYAPRVTVRDSGGRTVFAGAVIFLPKDGSFASDGVIKAPDAQPEGLAFEGAFLPTAAAGPGGAYSAFPDTLNPQLVLKAFTGDLGRGDGRPMSVFALDTSTLDPVLTPTGDPLTKALQVGQTMTLPDGATLTFDGVAQFANFQIAYDPGKEISLLAGLMLLIGLTISLTVGRRRLWVRVSAGHGGTRVEVATRSLTRRAADPSDLGSVLAALGAPLEASHSQSDLESSP
ncbi:cytochrome c biogenesis protein ResB [Nocardioides sp.]|uniref:cytochrome c biogenesis protein ResB n=1 Tax=Nocardioides sp. TaxID=35761 RepID=UPI0027335025|nr:cytochrome c biogenesis protein ResB [Nocardioides sp.]